MVCSAGLHLFAQQTVVVGECVLWLLFDHAAECVRGAGRILGAERLPVEKVEREDGEVHVAAADVLLEHVAVLLLEVAAGGAHVVDVDRDIDRALRPVLLGSLARLTVLQRLGLHDLEVFAEGHAARDHVERAGARGLHALREHERNHAEHRNDDERDAPLQKQAVALFALLLGLASKARLLARLFAALVLG